MELTCFSGQILLGSGGPTEVVGTGGGDTVASKMNFKAKVNFRYFPSQAKNFGRFMQKGKRWGTCSRLQVILQFSPGFSCALRLFMRSNLIFLRSCVLLRSTDPKIKSDRS